MPCLLKSTYNPFVYKSYKLQNKDIFINLYQEIGLCANGDMKNIISQKTLTRAI